MHISHILSYYEDVMLTIQLRDFLLDQVALQWTWSSSLDKDHDAPQWQNSTNLQWCSPGLN